MAHIVRFLFWSVGLAFMAWILKSIVGEEETLRPETVARRLRKSGI